MLDFGHNFGWKQISSSSYSYSITIAFSPNACSIEYVTVVINSLVKNSLMQ